MARYSTTATKSRETWICDAACFIRGAIEVGLRKKAAHRAKADCKLVWFCLSLTLDDPEQPVWSVIGKLADKTGEAVCALPLKLFSDKDIATCIWVTEAAKPLSLKGKMQRNDLNSRYQDAMAATKNMCFISSPRSRATRRVVA